MTASEISISIKNSESRYTKKFLVYEPYQLDITDPIIKQCLDEAKADIPNQEIESIKIKATLEL